MTTAAEIINRSVDPPDPLTLKKSLRPKAPLEPRVAVGAVVIHDQKILLVKRKNPPAQGQWAIPGGRVQLGETLQMAAEREIAEETDILIRAKEPVYTFDQIVRDDNGEVLFHYVIIDLAADFMGGILTPGDDALDAAWLGPHQLQSFNISHKTLKLLTRIGFFPISP